MKITIKNPLRVKAQWDFNLAILKTEVVMLFDIDVFDFLKEENSEYVYQNSPIGVIKKGEMLMEVSLDDDGDILISVFNKDKIVNQFKVDG